MLDGLFTVVFTNTVVVFVWRGAWVLLDALLYPHDLPMSVAGSLVRCVTILLRPRKMTPRGG